jgi:hypothetical protein
MQIPLIVVAALFGELISAGPITGSSTLDIREPKIPVKSGDPVPTKPATKKSPDCVYISAEFGSPFGNAATMSVRDRNGKWTRVCGGYGSGTNNENAGCCNGYSLKLDYQKIVGSTVLPATAGFDGYTLTSSFNVPQTNFDSSGCGPLKGGKLPGADDFNCLKVDWTLNTCPDLDKELTNGNVVNLCGK